MGVIDASLADVTYLQDGGKGTHCNQYDKGDPPVKTRPTCNEGLCCGATVPDGATILLDTPFRFELCADKTLTSLEPKHWVEALPSITKWTFECIEGAKTLAASTAAALGAAYLMA